MKLIDLLERYNFRYIMPNCDNEEKSNNTNIIRIYYGEEFPNQNRQWFEFGIYDYYGTRNTMQAIKSIIKEDILNKEVHFFCYDDDLDVICIYVGEEWEIE